MGEHINKSNFKATIERLNLKNVRNKIISNQNQIGNNPISIGKINVCSNSSESEQTKINKEEKYTKKREFKISEKVIKKLKDLGLTDEQIAEALEISIEQIDNVIK